MDDYQYPTDSGYADTRSKLCRNFKDSFSGLNLTGGYIWKYLHTAATYGSLILMSIHLGIHWKMILTEAGKMARSVNK